MFFRVATLYRVRGGGATTRKFKKGCPVLLGNPDKNMIIALLSQGLLSMIVVIPVILLISVIIVLFTFHSPVIPIILGIPIILVVVVIPPTLASHPSQPSHHCWVCYPRHLSQPIHPCHPSLVILVISVVPFIPATLVIPVILINSVILGPVARSMVSVNQHLIPWHRIGFDTA